MANDRPFRHNVFDQEEEDTETTLYLTPIREYEDLDKLISFAKFDYSTFSVKTQELEVLQPQLEALGYTEIVWLPGETDSFGPLTRVCRAFDKDGNLHWFVYG